jgi:hypothetical protein
LLLLLLLLLVLLLLLLLSIVIDIQAPTDLTLGEQGCHGGAHVVFT